MQYFDIMIGSMIMNNISELKTGFIIIDILLISLILIGSFIFNDHKLKTKLFDYINNFLNKKKKEKKVTFMFKRGEQSNRCKGLFHYLTSTNENNSHVNQIIEDVFFKYNRYTDDDLEDGNIYRVCQTKSFNFTDTIKGEVYSEEKEDSEFNGKVTYKEHIFLNVFSDTESLESIQKFIEDCRLKYNKFLKEQMLDQQYIITIETNNNDNSNDEKESLKISKEEWASNVTFDSRFFPDKENVIKTIDHFLENSEWYKEKGLNHTLGILLSGDPGCGKTSFIKALMNYTNRHVLEVKLNDDFNFSDLKDIIYDEKINDDIIVPQNKRIVVFEDIDAMGNIVKDRDLKEKENTETEKKFQEELKNIISKDFTDKHKAEIEKNTGDFVNIKSKISKNDNNNLSYLLNILDGINETPGRIIIMTTNKPHLLDSALIRPGRIDIRLNFTKSTHENLKEILFHYWKKNDETDKELKSDIFNSDMTKFNKKFTPAEIIGYCRESESYELTIFNLQQNL